MDLRQFMQRGQAAQAAVDEIIEGATPVTDWKSLRPTVQEILAAASLVVGIPVVQLIHSGRTKSQVEARTYSGTFATRPILVRTSGSRALKSIPEVGRSFTMSFYGKAAGPRATAGWAPGRREPNR